MPNTYNTTDNENFDTAGATPSQVNHLVWQGLPGVYLAATNNGLMKTVDGGQTWDYLRPNATFGGDWPAGSVGRQVAFAIGPRTCPEDEEDEECSGMFIVATNDMFSFDGAAVTTIMTDDPNQPAAPPNSSFCLKSFGDKLFWNARNSGDVGVIFRSEDGGITSIVGGDLAPGFLTQFDIDADGNLYALYSAASDGLYKSTDDGDTWALVIGSLDNSTGNGASVACHPTDANRIAFIELAGGISGKLRVSTNAGASFSSTLITEIPANGFNNFFGFQPRWLASGRLAWAFHEDFGALYVMYSDDDGASVAAAVSLMAFGTFQVFCGMWVDDNVLYLAAQDTSDDCHIFRSTDEGTSWTDLGVLGANGSYIQGMAFSDNAMYVMNDAPEMWKIPNPAISWVPQLVLDSSSSSPFGTGGTIDLNQDAMVNACVGPVNGPSFVESVFAAFITDRTLELDSTAGVREGDAIYLCVHNWDTVEAFAPTLNWPLFDWTQIASYIFSSDVVSFFQRVTIWRATVPSGALSATGTLGFAGFQTGASVSSVSVRGVTEAPAGFETIDDESDSPLGTLTPASNQIGLQFVVATVVALVDDSETWTFVVPGDVGTHAEGTVNSRQWKVGPTGIAPAWTLDASVAWAIATLILNES